MLMNPLPLPSSMDRYSLATFFMVCKQQPFSGNITTINSEGDKEKLESVLCDVDLPKLRTI